MKPLLVGLAALSLLATGCVIHGPHGSGRSSLASSKCPPGHQWSDGQCHGKGKGHDPAKHGR